MITTAVTIGLEYRAQCFAKRMSTEKDVRPGEMPIIARSRDWVVRDID
jgi:hypothetical protein